MLDSFLKFFGGFLGAGVGLSVGILLGILLFIAALWAITLPGRAVRAAGRFRADVTTAFGPYFLPLVVMVVAAGALMAMSYTPSLVRPDKLAAAGQATASANPSTTGEHR